MRYYQTESAARVEAQRAGRPPTWPTGRCCERAVKRFCVCLVSWDCPEHGATCVGSHD